MKFITLLLAASLAGCAGTFGSAPPPTPQTPVEVTPAPPPAPAIQAVEGEAWSLTVPAAWVRDGSQEDGTSEAKTELFIHSPKTVGRMPVVTSIGSLALDKPSDEGDFGGGVVLATLTSGKFKVLAAEPRTIGGKPGSAMAFLTPTGIFIAQYAVGHKGRGYILRCGGDARKAEQIAAVCEPIAESFKLK
jgi:hypothetical protein